MALVASLFDGSALRWTSMIFLLSSLIGGLLEGSTYSQTYQIADVINSSTMDFSGYQFVGSGMTLLGFYLTFRYFLFPNTVTALFAVGCGVMFILVAIMLNVETEEELFLSAGNITLIVFYYSAYGIANGAFYVLCPMFLRKLHRSNVNLASGYLAYSGSFQAVGIAAVAASDSLFGLIASNAINLLVIMSLIGLAILWYAYILYIDSEICEELLRESYAMKKLATRNRLSFRAQAAGASEAGNVGGNEDDEEEREREREFTGASLSGNDAVDGTLDSVLNSVESFQTTHPVPEAGFKAHHYHVEYLLFTAEVFRGGSIATTLTYLYDFLDNCDYDSLDVSNYEVAYGLTITAWLIGKLMSPLFQDLYGKLETIYAVTVAMHVISALLFLPFMAFASLQTPVVFIGSLIIYGFVNGPSYALLLDLNNRLTYETSYSSIILIVANILGFIYSNVVSWVYYANGNTDTFLWNIVVCAVMAGSLCGIAPLFSYVPKGSDVEIDRSTRSERQPILAYT